MTEPVSAEQVERGLRLADAVIRKGVDLPDEADAYELAKFLRSLAAALQQRDERIAELERKQTARLKELEGIPLDEWKSMAKGAQQDFEERQKAEAALSESRKRTENVLRWAEDARTEHLKRLDGDYNDFYVDTRLADIIAALSPAQPEAGDD